MIVPMKKCLVVMLDSERGNGLKALRKLGLVHVEPVTGSGKDLESLKAERELLERAINALDGVKAPRGIQPSGLSGLEAAKRFESLSAERKNAQESLGQLVRERDRVAPLGEFDPGLLSSLADSGYEPRLHVLNAKQTNDFPAECLVTDLGEDKGKAAFLSLSPASLAASSLPPVFAPPAIKLSALEAEIARARENFRKIEAGIAALTQDLPALRSALRAVRSAEEFENVRTGASQEGPIVHLRGWIPASAETAFLAEAAKQGWGAFTDDPGDDENPPTKVNNNPLVRIVQPVFDFLGTIPNYREYEISAWFLLFFCVFFAMIFGDGGYGVLMLASAGLFAIRSKISGKKVPDGIRLFILLALFTIGWGVVTGSWFALPEDVLPSGLKALTVPAIAAWNPDSSDNIKILCFILGLVQLAMAHVKNIVRDIKAKSLKVLGQIGSFAMVTGMFWIVLNLVIDPARFPIPNFSPILVLGGFILVFAFSNYERNIGQSVVDGVKNIIPIFLGVVNVFADIVSYIRLWAVGLAGLAISQTVNGMAGELFQGLSFWAVAGALLIVAFGHGLNLVMGALSVIVHGVRLNMLEFSSHLGMEWSGYKYEPFSEGAAGAQEKETL